MKIINVRIVGVCDRNKKVGKSLGKDIKFLKVTKTSSEKLDAIFVCMPNNIAPLVCKRQ